MADAAIAGYFATLLRYNTWANETIFRKAAELSEADYFAERPGLSFGSLHGTLAHIVSGEETWTARWQAALSPDAGPRDVSTAAMPATLAGLNERWRAHVERMDAVLAGHLDDASPFAVEVPYVLPGGPAYTHTLALQIAHVVNHSTQFRAEAAVRLTELGHSPGNIDLTVVLRGMT